jgi:3-phenylpropionate/trans-cinnamate dioxygenase ferredoxin component
MNTLASNSGVFIPVIATDRVVDVRMTAVTVKGKRLIIARVEGHLFAFERACPHAAADLMKGSLGRRKICCHEHDYCFDLRTGRIVWPQDEHLILRGYEVREEGDMILVKM